MSWCGSRRTTWPRAAPRNEGRNHGCSRDGPGGDRHYIARDNPARAASFVRAFFSYCVDIADMPEPWSVVPRYEHHGVRRRVHGRYLISYRVGSDRITILHILNRATDVEAILFP